MELVKLDAIVLDLNLAGENGLLLMEFLKQKHPGVPILIYTALTLSQQEVRELNGHVQAIVSKSAREQLLRELDTYKRKSPTG